ncbi:MAG TPA: DUF5663 domain-containing protein [Candidatus Saccharimonadales bacterium]|nr:DUF5663 domain-containing protein [Candidatus Saccharimonadales bacterium]
MIRLDDNLLQELGLGALPPEEKDKFLKHIYETLEMRVGTRLAERMTDQQLDEFETFIDRKDDAGAFHWLETNFPNYKEVVAEEFEKLKTEIKAVAPDIITASAQQHAAAGGAPQSAPMSTGMPPQPPLPPQPPVDPQQPPVPPFDPTQAPQQQPVQSPQQPGQPPMPPVPPVTPPTQ